MQELLETWKRWYDKIKFSFENLAKWPWNTFSPNRVIFYVQSSLICNWSWLVISYLSLSDDNRPFAGSGHVVRNKLCRDASYTVGLSKQRKVGLDWYEFLCFESPTALLASQRNLFRTIWPDPAKGLLAIKSQGCLNSNRTLHVNSGKQTVFYKCADRVRSLPVFFCVTWHHTIIPLQLGLEMGRHDEWMPFRFSCQRPTGRRLTDPNISRSEWKKWSTFP